MKKIICFVLALLLLCPTAFAAKDLTFSFSEAQGEVGDTVTIVASSKGAPLACSYKLVLVYDTKVLKPVKVTKLESEGFFMSNLEATYEGKAAVNALTASATKAFEGDCDLFSVSFEILAKPDGGKSVIDIPYYECYDGDLKMLDAAFDECSVKVGKAAGNDAPDENTGKDPAPDENTGEGAGGKDPSDTNNNTDTNTGKDPATDNNTTGNDTATDNNTNGNDTATDNNTTGNDTATDNTGSGTATGDPSAESDKAESDKEPAGKWEVFEKTEEITYSENGNIDIFKGEFIRDEEDKLTDIKLYDEEGKPAGSLKVEEKEDGTIEVIEHRAEDTDQPFNHLYWIIPAAILLIAGGVAAFMIMNNKQSEKKKEEEIEE